MMAYNVGPRQLDGATGWMQSERYDVVGKAPDGSIHGSVGRAAGMAGLGGAGSNWTALDPNSENARQFRSMMQTLLEDRFQLKLHRETRKLPVYALLAANGEPSSSSRNPPLSR